ncbi:hypothetical protein D6833_07185 [Candidatus Parcubacteria bacterium]|nr:MAG: hypothetical protein D6833_07185 [Candidatus Parcubacteria bacterium]
MPQTKAIEPVNSDVFSLLLEHAGRDKSQRSRVRLFIAWMQRKGYRWNAPHLGEYRDELLENHAPATVAAYVATVRAAYNALINDNRLRQALYNSLPSGYDPADRRAFVEEALDRLRAEIRPEMSSVQAVTVQDEEDSSHVRLTAAQANALLAAPGVDTLRGLRDTAIIAMFLCTGVRQGELVSTQVDDLRQYMDGELALRVRAGKGAKKRLIPYGELSWVLAIVDKWMARAGIHNGPVFRGIHRSGHVLKKPLTTRSVERIVARYPVMINGELRHVTPHDLRRTYARRLYEAGMELMAIQNNLGHANLATTQLYIGALDAERRRAPAVYHFDLTSLEENY